MALRSGLHAQGLVAVKDGGSAGALRHEAGLLADLVHPGIIRFVELAEDEAGPRLLTRYAGRETLATWHPERVEELAAVFVDLAEAVRYLHAQGVVHRSIRPAHVVIDAHRRPLLCGFSAARRVADPSRSPAPGAAHADVHDGGTGDRMGVEVDSASPALDGGTRGVRSTPVCDGTGAATGAELDPAAEQLADVAAVGATLLAAIDGVDEQRPRGTRRRDDQRLRVRLRAVAQAAADGRIPSAKALAAQILAHRSEAAGQHLTGTAAAGHVGGERPQRGPEEALRHLRMPTGVETRRRLRLPTGDPGWHGSNPRRTLRRAHRGRRRPRRATVAAVATVCAGSVLGAVMVMNIDSGGAAAPAMVGGGTLDGLDTLATRDISTAGRGQEAGFAAPNTSATATASPSAQTPGEGGASAPAPEQDAAACRLPARGWRDVDGDGCAEEILITSGSVLVDGVGYPIGEAGDQVAVGDWDCDGVATVALVQSGGRVYVFDGWPDSTTLDGRLVADLTPPVLLADATRGRCHELVVRYAAGIWHLPLPTAQN